MALYLVHREQFEFKANLPTGVYQDHINFSNQVLSDIEICEHFGIDILNGKSPSTEEDPWISENRFGSRVSPLFFNTDDRPRYRKLTVAMSITRDETVYHHRQEMESGWLHTQIFSLGQSSILDVARKMKNIKIGVKLESFEPSIPGSRIFLHSQQFKDLKIDRWFSAKDNDYRIGCKLPRIQIPGFAMSMLSSADQGPNFRGHISVFLICYNAAVNSLFTHNPSRNSVNVLKEMLEKEICSDFELISSDKNRLKCHRSILSSISPVFNAMLEPRAHENGLAENAQNSAEVLDGNMTKTEVQAFLKYLYYGNIITPLEDCQMAFTMLKAGDYYQIPNLVKEMQDVLLIKSGLMTLNGEWVVDVDTAVNLLMFCRRKSDEIMESIIEETLFDNCAVRRPIFQAIIVPPPGEDSDNSVANGDENVEKDKQTCNNKMRDRDIRLGWKDLKAKSLYVLKWWAKNKPGEFKASEKFKQIWRESEDFAEEIGTEFLQLS